MAITTTPTFGFDFQRNPDEVSDLYVSFIQAGVVRLKVEKEDITFTGTVGVFQLTEEECKNFCHANYVQIQVGVVENSGESYVVNSVTVPVYYADYSNPEIIGFKDDEISVEYAAQILYALSPSASVTDTSGGALVTITDKTGTTSEEVYDGATGPQGEKGDKGDTGKGVASFELVSGDHSAGTIDTYRMTFTDGTSVDVEVYNGEDGSGAVHSVNGRAGDVVLSKTDVGLGNVDNTSDLNKPVSTAVQTALNNKVDKVTGKGLSTNDYTTAEKAKLAGIETGAQVNTITGVKGNSESSYRVGNVNITKANIGLGNVDNTSDANKPISTVTQTALNAKVNKTDIATTSDLGLVKPDGTSITIDADGTIHSMGGGGGGTSIYYFYQQRVSVASSAEILRISSNLITENTIVLECTFNSPFAISGGVTWTSYNGYISFIGTCIKATKANVVLANKGN